MIAVTGSTGELGGRIAAGLAKKGVPQRLIVRDPKRAPKLTGAEVAQASGYTDIKNLGRALSGVETLMMTPAHDIIAYSRLWAGAGTLFSVKTDEDVAKLRLDAEKRGAMPPYNRVEQHKALIYAAAAVGVERIIYVSTMNAAEDSTFILGHDHYQTEQLIRNAGLKYTFLRFCLYADRVAAHCSLDGVMRGAAGNGRAAWVARDDVAEVAVVALTEKGHDNQTYDVTGPEALTMYETVDVLSKAAGRKITYQPQTPHEGRVNRSVSGLDYYEAERQALTGHGVSDLEVDILVSHFHQIATGELEPASDTVPKLTGHKAQSLAEYLDKHPESYKHLLP